MFITFEGIDGCGKSTQARMLQERITAHFQAQESATAQSSSSRNSSSKEIVFVRDPGNTAVSEAIRAIVLDKSHNSMTFRTELLLYAAARAQLVDTCIRPALERGAIVISDRFVDSTTAYQGFGRNLSLADIHAANMLATSGIMPDCTFFLHIPLHEAKTRSSEKTADRIESAGDAFFERVIQGYTQLAQSFPQRVKMLDAAQNADALHEEIWGIIENVRLMR
ncbi:MAG: dTMP kinase [Candidatus Kapaibacterium sp.]|nr:MAG: dTMP kinase [Candidatus Kapabacteria bacterium]